MTAMEFRLDEQAGQWEEQIILDPESTAAGSFKKLLSDGLEGRPEAFLARVPAEFKNRPHFHSEAQFQVLLEGAVTFPDHAMESISVHYSDRNTPYGPFVGPTPFTLAVLRPRKCLGKGHMDDPEERKQRDPYGRELFGLAAGAPWESLTGELAGTRRKVLFGSDAPAAELWECEAGLTIARPPTPFGEYQLIVSGSAQVGETQMEPYSMRYVVGNDQTAPLVTGPDKATLLLLTFDRAAA